MGYRKGNCLTGKCSKCGTIIKYKIAGRSKRWFPNLCITCAIWSQVHKIDNRRIRK